MAADRRFSFAINPRPRRLLHCSSSGPRPMTPAPPVPHPPVVAHTMLTRSSSDTSRGGHFIPATPSTFPNYVISIFKLLFLHCLCYGPLKHKSRWAGSQRPQNGGCKAHRGLIIAETPAVYGWVWPVSQCVGQPASELSKENKLIWNQLG